VHLIEHHFKLHVVRVMHVGIVQGGYFPRRNCIEEPANNVRYQRRGKELALAGKSFFLTQRERRVNLARCVSQLDAAPRERGIL